MMIRRMSKALFLPVTVSFLLIFYASCSSTQNQGEEITLADASVVWWMGTGIVAQKQNIYEKNGLKVKTFDVQTGLASKNAVLDGSADVGLVASSPLAAGAFKKENLVVLASYIKSDQLLAVITPKSDEKESKPTPPVAIVKGTISEIYFYNYMTKYFFGETEIIKNQLNVNPPNIGNSIKSGDAKSAVIWEPFATMIVSGNSNLKANRPIGLYMHRIYIVTTPETLQKKRKAIENFVQSFKDACDSINKNPDQAKKDILSKTGFDAQAKSMNDLWNGVTFEVEFDYDNMKSLILKDAETMSKLEQTPKDEAGNFRQLKPEDVQHYFNHDFKLTPSAGQ